MNRLSGVGDQVAIVTGASSGIGEATAEGLHDFGMKVIIIEPGPVPTEWGGAAYDSAEKYSGAGAYAPQVRAMKALYAQADERGTEPSVIADTIVSAVTASRPKVRYAAPFSAEAIIATVTLVPDRILDAGLRAMMSRARP